MSTKIDKLKKHPFYHCRLGPFITRTGKLVSSFSDLIKQLLLVIAGATKYTASPVYYMTVINELWDYSFINPINILFQ